MKSIDEYTRMTPGNRIRKLLEFNQRLNSTADSTRVLEEWNMKLDGKLVEVPGRVLKNETILWGTAQKYDLHRENWKVFTSSLFQERH